jgi:hypothetical protein
MDYVRIQQFNPVTQCWNTIHEIESNVYNPDTFTPVNKYGGPFRVLFPEKKIDFSIKDVVQEMVFEEEPPFVEAEGEENQQVFDDVWR